MLVGGDIVAYQHVRFAHPDVNSGLQNERSNERLSGMYLGIWAAATQSEWGKLHIHLKRQRPQFLIIVHTVASPLIIYHTSDRQIPTFCTAVRE